MQGLSFTANCLSWNAVLVSCYLGALGGMRKEGGKGLDICRLNAGGQVANAVWIAMKRGRWDPGVVLNLVFQLRIQLSHAHIKGIISYQQLLCVLQPLTIYISLLQLEGSLFFTKKDNSPTQISLRVPMYLFDHHYHKLRPDAHFSSLRKCSGYFC